MPTDVVAAAVVESAQQLYRQLGADAGLNERRMGASFLAQNAD